MQPASQKPYTENEGYLIATIINYIIWKTVNSQQVITPKRFKGGLLNN